MLREIESLSDLANVRDTVSALPHLPCNTCHFRDGNFCGALFGRTGQALTIKAKYRETAARRNIYRAGEPNEGVLVICDGWAVRFVQLPNGKRQILSLLLPGDLASPAAILDGQLAFSVQAVTDVRYCHFPFADVHDRIRVNPSLFDVWLRLTAAEQRDADKRLVDLGQRTAQERIAALLVHVMLRCERRGELLDDEFPFPLSQQQIADFTGLTPVHTCRVLSSLRKAGVCDVGRGFVKVLARRDLLQLGSLR